MIDEGYVKYQGHWVQTPALPQSQVRDLTHYRHALWQLGLIGQYPNGIGFGNVSQRLSQSASTFIISGTQTGHLPTLDAAHYATVTAFDIERNQLTCKGPIRASSEALTHAVIYQTVPETQAIFHIHHDGLWKTLMHQVPTTAATVPYGTPEMAREMIRLLPRGLGASSKILVMAGHPEGLITFGNSQSEAYATLKHYYQAWKAQQDWHTPEGNCQRVG
ncbi:MAG: class II aldolase/adducin family protein [Cyanobacteria bacterium P01_A01_bin.114]